MGNVHATLKPRIRATRGLYCCWGLGSVAYRPCPYAAYEAWKEKLLHQTRDKSHAKWEQKSLPSKPSEGTLFNTRRFLETR